MKKLALLLAAFILMGSFVACTPETSDGHTTPKPSVNDTPDENDENKEEEDDMKFISMYYDDRTDLYELVGIYSGKVQIKDEVVTSKIVGSNDADMCVLRYDASTKRVIAVGTGTAVLVVGEQEFNIKVSPAPITLAVITGHSLGAGAKGNSTDSVVCEAGQAYNSTLTINKEGTKNDGNPNWADKMKGNTLGYAESNRVTNIDCITGDAGSVKGARGVNAAFAYQWNNLTGEKIWVVNCAVGGSCINQWQPGASSNYHTYSLAAINLASEILKGEVEAGHYEYRMTVMINFSSANFAYQGVKDYDDAQLQKWHDDMWQGYVEGSTVDIDGDGKIDAPTHLGYAPIWTPTLVNFDRDYHLIYYRSASKEYPNVFLASDFVRHWKTDEGVKNTFPNIRYTTQSGNKLTRPGKVSQVFDADGTHLLQIGYNAVGMQIADNLYNHLFGAKRIDGVTIFESSENIQGTVIEDTMTMKMGHLYKFILITDPMGVSDYTIELSNNLKLEGFFYVSATAAGEGTITIKRGDTVVRTITVNVE